jgi:hypothetical protein
MAVIPATRDSPERWGLDSGDVTSGSVDPRGRPTSTAWRIGSAGLVAALTVVGALALAFSAADGLILFSGGLSGSIPTAALVILVILALILGCAAPILLAVSGARRARWRLWMLVGTAGVCAIAVAMFALEIMLLAGVFRTR